MTIIVAGRRVAVEHRKLGRKEKAESTELAMPRSGRELGDRLDKIKSRIDRLSPDHHRPERFHEERSEISRELLKLSAWAHRQKD